MKHDKLISVPIELLVTRAMAVCEIELHPIKYAGAIRTHGTLSGAGVSWSAPSFHILDVKAQVGADVTSLVMSGQIIVTS